jgi:hypothetical protein
MEWACDDNGVVFPVPDTSFGGATRSTFVKSTFIDHDI